MVDGRTARRRPNGQPSAIFRSTASGSASSASPTRTSRSCVFPGALGPFRSRSDCRPSTPRRRGSRERASMPSWRWPQRRDGRQADRPDRAGRRPGRRRDGVDVVIGDHTDIQVLTTRPNGVLLTENRSKGVRFTRVRLVVDTARARWSTRRPTSTGRGSSASRRTRRSRPGSTSSTRSWRRSWQRRSGHRPWRSRAPTPAAPRRPHLRELVGNVVTDAMRTTYGDRLRDHQLRRPPRRPDLPDHGRRGRDFCPAELPPNAITRGQVLTVLPFGNVVGTVRSPARS